MGRAPRRWRCGYILENMGRVHLREMALQVCEQINTIPGKCMTPEQFDDLLGVAGRARETRAWSLTARRARSTSTRRCPPRTSKRSIDLISSLYRSDRARALCIFRRHMLQTRMSHGNERCRRGSPLRSSRSLTATRRVALLPSARSRRAICLRSSSSSASLSTSAPRARR